MTAAPRAVTRLVTAAADPRDLPAIAVAVPAPGRGVELRAEPLAEILWGDRRAGWLRDFPGVAEWARDAGLRSAFYERPGGTLHVCRRPDAGDPLYLLGIERPGRATEWVATRSPLLAQRIAAEMADELAEPPAPKPAPVPPAATPGWSLAALSAASPC